MINRLKRRLMGLIANASLNASLIAPTFVACSDCFVFTGLKLDVLRFGVSAGTACPNCGSIHGAAIDKERLETVAHRYFVLGTTYRRSSDYGSAPLLQYNEHQVTSGDIVSSLGRDLELLSELLGVGFFYYGPNMWMLGQITPLDDLIDPDSRDGVLERLVHSYGICNLSEKDVLYRVRRNPTGPLLPHQFDSPPDASLGKGRLDSAELPVLYASQDLEVCLHECRVIAEDEIYLATLKPKKELKLLDLSKLLVEEQVSQFESLDMAVHFLFRAGSHSYEVCRAIAVKAHQSGFDGLIFPSFFSEERTGTSSMDTVYGISSRVFHTVPGLSEERKRAFIEKENSRVIPNIALFGRPVREGLVEVSSIDKVFIENVRYALRFGPPPDRLAP